MPRITFAFLVLLVSLPAAAGAWQVDKARSTLTFHASFEGEGFDGKFPKFDARISYDANNLADSLFDVTVDLASVDTASSERDQTLTTSDFFDVSKFPQAHFVASRFHRSADGKVTADGTLTLRGVSKPVVLTVVLKPEGNDTATLDVDATLDRLGFGLGTGSDWSEISKQVTVHGHLVLTGS